MKKYSIVIFIILLFACKKEKIDTEGKVIWKPKPIAYIGDKEVHLKWFNNSDYEKILLPYEIIEPNKFEIYISENNYPNFRKLTEFENRNEYSYTITGLENNQPVYFYVSSLKKGFDKLLSDTIMVIPNKETTPDDLVIQSDSHTIVSVSVANNVGKIAYVDKFHSWNGGENCCMNVSVFISNINGSQSELLDINAYEPCWSPNNNKIVFRTENNEINLGNGMPSQIALYDYSSKSITKLTDDTISNYSPVFSEDGEMILHLSTKGISDAYSTNIWLINLNSLEKKQLTNLETSELINFGRVNWIDNESYIFHATQKDYKNQIYKSGINSNITEKVIKSDWNDYCPVVSPNDKMIAFISDRSGANQVWIYDLDTQKYKQITGYSNEFYISRGWNRIEWINNQSITFTLNENKLVKQKIE